MLHSSHVGDKPAIVARNMQFITFSLFIITVASLAGLWSQSNPTKIQKKGPAGILRTIIKKQSVYVDKTGFILRLIQSTDHCFFISRPRKFGKSLLLDTIKEIFSGNKELFEGREIYNSSYDWRKYPILNFDFSTPDKRSTSTKKFETKLEQEIWHFGNASNAPEARTNYLERLRNILDYLHDCNNIRPVVLVDEYDFPILSNADPDSVEECQKILKNFFQILEDAQVRFLLVTGVSMTTLTSIWKNPDTLRDITMDPSYSTLLGYTEDEYRFNFRTKIKKFIERKNVSEDSIRTKIRFLYNGYRFSSTNESVHNPVSLGKYLDKMEFKNYWIELQTPEFLINQMWRRHREAVSLLLRSTVEFAIFQTRYDDLHKMPLIALLFRTGYLTIKEYYPKTDSYVIDFPNEEVRESYVKCLMNQFGAVGFEDLIDQRETIRENLDEIQIHNFVENLQMEFHRMLDILAKLEKEDVFGFTFRTVLSLCTESSVEVKDSPLPMGRNDFLSLLPKVFYVFEVQLIPGANFTMSRAQVEQYRKKYGDGREKMVTLSLRYSRKTCFIENWIAMVYEHETKVADYSASTPSN